MFSRIRDRLSGQREISSDEFVFDNVLEIKWDIGLEAALVYPDGQEKVEVPVRWLYINPSAQVNRVTANAEESTMNVLFYDKIGKYVDVYWKGTGGGQLHVAEAGKWDDVR